MKKRLVRASLKLTNDWEKLVWRMFLRCCLLPTDSQNLDLPHSKNDFWILSICKKNMSTRWYLSIFPAWTNLLSMNTLKLSTGRFLTWGYWLPKNCLSILFCGIWKCRIYSLSDKNPLYKYSFSTHVCQSAVS